MPPSRLIVIPDSIRDPASASGGHTLSGVRGKTRIAENGGIPRSMPDV